MDRLRQKTALWRAITVVIALYAVVLQALAASALPAFAAPGDQGVICHGTSGDGEPSGSQNSVPLHGLCCSLACAGANLSGPLPAIGAEVAPPSRLVRPAVFPVRGDAAPFALGTPAFDARGPPSAA
jgi:hypothetical protein